jgi:arabinofuranan 3-O-arabinosyltransferase
VAGCVLLVGIAFVQSPGFLVADTKFDLVLDPAALLGRALHLWDAGAALGQLQNQAYGYLLPMGPFFLAGIGAGIPGWVVQRLWLALVMAVAFSGTAKVTRALGVRSDLACLVAGFAYALSPRMLTTLGPISIEAWPSALAPWVLLPLVLGSTAGSPRRAAALSALAVAMVGGVNAAATFAVVPLAVVWLLTRSPGPRRRALMLWWSVCTAIATLWWVVPLFVMGAYSPPFLDYIETTSVTTFPTTVFDTLRGTSNWVPYVSSDVRAGNDLLRLPYLVIDGAVVLLLGFAGLLDRRTPHRTFLALSLLVGTVMVAAGHRGAVEGWFAGDLRDLLDGVLAPLRNVHKFDPVLRLPLVVGLAWLLERLRDRAAVPVAQPGSTRPARHGSWSGRLDLANRLAATGMVLLAVAGTAVPALVGRIAPAGATLGVPGYWHETAEYLEGEPDDGTALLVPGSAFGSYVWGSPHDEPMQALARSSWAVRNVIPLTPPGNIRTLDEIERRLAEGTGSVGFTALLRRAGVSHLVVRNDLQRSSDVPDPVLVHQALAQSPGLERVATFGPDLGGGGHLESNGERVLVNDGWQGSYPAVEVYAVAESMTSAWSSGALPVVVGGPEDLADLADLGVLADQPTVLAADAQAAGIDAPAAGYVLTDGLRARERVFSRLHDGASPVVSRGHASTTGNPHRDYLIDQDDRWGTTEELRGAVSVTASSSRADAGAAGGSRRGELPYAAVDGDPDTQFVSAPSLTGTAYWRLDLGRATASTAVTLTGGDDAPDNQVVRVRTAHGTTEAVELGPGQTRLVDLPGGATEWLRVEDASGTEGRVLALSEVALPDVRVQRWLVTPTVPASWGSPEAVVLRADLDRRTGCVVVGADTRCSPRHSRSSEEESGLARIVDLPAAGLYTATLRLRPRPGPALDSLVLRDQALSVEASSTAVPDPRASAVSAVDGDDGTTWIADAGEVRPYLQLRWLRKQRITGVQVSIDDDAAGRLPTRLKLSSPEGVRVVRLDDAGRAEFAPLRTDQLRVQVRKAETTTSLGFDTVARAVGVGIGELELEGLPYLPLGLSAQSRSLGCGSGPEVRVGDDLYQTALRASAAELHGGVPVTGTLCRGSKPTGEVALASGETRISSRATGAAFAVDALVLTRGDLAQGTGAAVAEVSQGLGKQIVPEDGAAVVGLRQNLNPGWVATQDGERLEPVTVDGWQQGWLLRSTDRVTAEFPPDRLYRWGLALGAASLMALLLLVWRLRGQADTPPTTARELPALLAAALVLLAGAQLAGLVGLALGVGVLVVTWLLRRAVELRQWLLALPCLAAGAAYAIEPWGSSAGWAGSDAWTSYVMLVPLLGVLGCVAVSGRPGRRMVGLRSLFRRRAGRSTVR